MTPSASGRPKNTFSGSGSRGRGVGSGCRVGVEFANRAERLGGEVGQLAGAVFFDVAILLQRRLHVAEEPWEDLIDDGFLAVLIHSE